MDKKFKFKVDKITFEVTVANKGGAVTSNIDEVLGMTAFHTDDQYNSSDVYGAYKDALYSFILGYFCNGGLPKRELSAGVRAVLRSIEQYDFI